MARAGLLVLLLLPALALAARQPSTLPAAILAAGLAGGGLALLWPVLRAVASRGAAASAAVLLLYSTSLLWAVAYEPQPLVMAAFAATAGALRLAWPHRRGLAVPLAAAAAAAILLLLLLGPRPEPTLVLFSSARGLFSWTPVLWVALLGIVARGRREPLTALALLLPAGVLALALSAVPLAGPFDARFSPALGLLAVGLGVSLETLRRLTARRPWATLAGTGLLLLLWNALLMRQYRYLLPRDEPVAFARLAENGATLVTETVGAPVAWPANWVFAAREGIDVARFDTLVGKDLFHGADDGVIEIGDPDPAEQDLLGDGWGRPRPCAPGWCRPLDGRGRMFVPLGEREDLAVVVVARGRGTLTLMVNGRAAAPALLREEGMDLAFSPPAAAWKRGVNEVGLLADVSTTALVDRVILRRVATR